MFLRFRNKYVYHEVLDVTDLIIATVWRNGVAFDNLNYNNLCDMATSVKAVFDPISATSIASFVFTTNLFSYGVD